MKKMNDLTSLFILIRNYDDKQRSDARNSLQMTWSLNRLKTSNTRKHKQHSKRLNPLSKMTSNENIMSNQILC